MGEKICRDHTQQCPKKGQRETATKFNLLQLAKSDDRAKKRPHNKV